MDKTNTENTRESDSDLRPTRRQTVEPNSSESFCHISPNNSKRSGTLLKAEKKQLRDPPVSKNVRPQLIAGNAIAGHMLKRRPPLRLDQRLVVEPIRNGLLANARSPQETPDPLGQSRLAARDLDRAPERSNVLFLHNHPLYTSMLVKVNANACLEGDKSSCTVLPMLNRARKASAPEEPKRHPSIGRDGRTIAERLKIAMDSMGMSESDLIKRCNEIAGEGDDGKPLVTQQAVNQLRKGKTKASRLVPILAEALDVRAVWLQWGIGERTDNRLTISDVIKKLQGGAAS